MPDLKLQPTPLVEEPGIARLLGINKLYIKHEEMNPTGSNKDRSIWPMIEYYLGQGKHDFVISSSGNAAVSAAYYILHMGRSQTSPTLRVFISPNIDQGKRVRLERVIGDCDRVIVEEVSRPKQSAFQFAKDEGAVYLRGSRDDVALSGYRELATELFHEQSNINAIFVPTSSGTTAVGLYSAYKRLLTNNIQSNIPQVHIVQTSKIYPIAEEFDTDFEESDTSLATAIVDNVAHRKNEVIDAVRGSGGFGWVISDEELKEAESVYIQNSGFHASNSQATALAGGQIPDYKISFDSMLSLAALQKAVKKSWKFDGVVVLLFTGV